MSAWHVIDTPSDDAWREARRRYITATDSAAILRCSPWATPLTVWASKRGIQAVSDSPAMAWGRRLEAVVADAAAEELGLAVQTPPRLLASARYPWLAASLDRWILGQVGPPEPVEIKTSSETDGWGPTGSTQIPPHYYIQVQHQMIVVGAAQAHLVALLRGSDLRHYIIRGDDETQTAIIEATRAFALLVQSGQQPSPDWTHPSTPSLIRRLHPPHPGHVDLPRAADELARRLAEIKERVAELTAQRESLEAQLIAMLGGAEMGRTPEGIEVRWQSRHRASYTVPATTFHTLTVRRPHERR